MNAIGQTIRCRRHPSISKVTSIRFAHPSEQIFATLLDIYDIEWEYEPIELVLEWDKEGKPCGGFRPDFWLPQHSCFVELTVADQRLVTRKNKKIRRMRELYPELNVTIVYQKDFMELLQKHNLSLGAQAVA